MKNLSTLSKVPYLFGFLCLALMTLMAFQIHWLNTSKRLIEQQFDQRVSLAVGSALSTFNANYGPPSSDKSQCNTNPPLGNFSSFLPNLHNPLNPQEWQILETSIHDYMACYGIEEAYQVEIYDKREQSFSGSYCCAISSLGGCESPYMLGVSFPSKNEYLYDKMSPMIFSSILIFLLLASVSFIILWSLARQKRITENNIDFFNNTAHEFKTPLTNISLALKLLRTKHKTLQADKYAQIIEAENSKLSDQIERVLFLAKMESGEYHLKKEVLVVKELVREVVDNMRMAVNEKEGQVQLNLPAGNPKILGDYYHLSNVFRNLIDNALKYCDKEPQIEITVEEDEHQVRVSVRDNGIGISSQDQHHIFEKFQRVNTGNIRRAKGFGLGLSYVKTVIEMHKGLVQVESELHKGSQFQLFIPNA